jgi:hypothetical protein
VHALTGNRVEPLFRHDALDLAQVINSRSVSARSSW